MTLVIIQRTADQLGFTAFADSMFSTAHRSAITTGGPKLFTLPVAIYDSRSKPVYRRTFGFAFAGSALVANSVFAFCASALQTMRLDTGGKVPSLAEISRFVATIAKEYIEEVAITHGAGARAELAVFGFCPATDKLRLFLARPEFDPHFEMSFGELDASQPGSLRFLGNTQAVDFFLQRISEGANSVALILQEAINSDELKDVGGSVQVLRVDKQGARNLPTLHRGHDGAHLRLLGKPIEKLGPLGDCHFRNEAWGPLD